MPPHSFYILITALVLVALVATAGLLLPIQGSHASHPLLIVECDNYTITVPLPHEGLLLAYTWTHSVEGTPITEVYNVSPEGLTLIRAEAESFGAGHPYSAQELGGNYTIEEGKMIYYADYYMGKSLEILGHPDYNGTIIVSQPDASGKLVCTGFVRASIRVSP